MKVFISADIEGISATTFWNDQHPDKPDYVAHAKRMTEEVVAACNGALKAGATEIVVRDAHGWANNIDITKLPEKVKLIRGWSGSPYLMVDGIDNSFDAVVFVGYHSGASKSGNPLSHTESLNPLYVKLNGEIASEFKLFSYAAALEGVPSVFLSGDKMLCEENNGLHPSLITYPVKEGKGASTLNYNASEVLKGIENNVEQALKQDLSQALIKLPETFELEICYKDHTKAEEYSYFPGVKKINDNTLLFKSNNYYEILRTFKFIN